MSSIHDKIKKLLALSSSSNENEAAVALGIAQKLMLEHGISEDQLSSTPDRPRVDYGDFFEVNQPFQYKAAAAAGVLYGVKAVWHGNKKGIRFVGREENREVAALTWSFLLLQIEEWYKNDLPKGMTQKERSRYRKEYKVSMAERLWERCNEIEPTSDCTALVVLKDQLIAEVQDFFEEEGIVSTKRSRRILDPEAHLRGRMAGDAADIHKPTPRQQRRIQ